MTKLDMKAQGWLTVDGKRHVFMAVAIAGGCRISGGGD